MDNTFRSVTKLCFCWRISVDFPFGAQNAGKKHILDLERARGCYEGRDTDPDLSTSYSLHPDEL